MAYINKRPILDKLHINIEDVQNSKKWFNSTVQKLKKPHVSPNGLLFRDGLDSLKTNLVPGNLYFFYYDPKLKDTLPYYDQFPLVFPYKPAPGGFLGLNLHYLDYQERYALFSNLLKINGDILDDRTKIKYQWSNIVAMSNVPNAKKCIKHYLVDHVRSRYMKIEPDDFMTCMMLPVEKFVGESKERVWAK